MTLIQRVIHLKHILPNGHQVPTKCHTALCLVKRKRPSHIQLAERQKRNKYISKNCAGWHKGVDMLFWERKYLHGACHPCTALSKNHVWRMILCLFYSINVESRESVFPRKPQVIPLFQTATLDFIDSLNKYLLWAIHYVCLVLWLALEKDRVPAFWKLRAKPRIEE